ncbi:MAG: hypothetical protein AB1733_24710 [Thermodesulfobacteriota bacterium]
MKFTLFHKIFSAFMITILAAIVVLALTIYFSANWRFSEYVTKVEISVEESRFFAIDSSRLSRLMDIYLAPKNYFFALGTFFW